MTAMRTIEIELPDDLTKVIDQEVALHGYASDADFVLACLETHLGIDRPTAVDPQIERWLREDVAPTFDRWKRENTPGLTSAEVFDGLEARYLARKRTG